MKPHINGKTMLRTSICNSKLYAENRLWNSLSTQDYVVKNKPTSAKTMIQQISIHIMRKCFSSCSYSISVVVNF